MHKTIILALNRFPKGSIPQSLLESGNSPKNKISVSISKLCHHMLLDTYGTSSNSKLLLPLMKKNLTNSHPLEFHNGSLGSHKEAKIAESMRFGKAFCRWFLSEHFQAVYFAHMDHILNKAPSPKFRGVRIMRASSGDTPDYLCASGQNMPFLAEAKGRQSGAITFHNNDFGKWRRQFSTIQVLDSHGRSMKTKGYIVATRLKIASQQNVTSKLFAEDPESPGDTNLSEDAGLGFQDMALHHHYSSIFEVLGLFLHADALREHLTLDYEEPVVVGVWRCLLPSLSHLRFVGGILPSEETQVTASSPFLSPIWIDPIALRARFSRTIPVSLGNWSPYLTATRQTFFGLEETLFKQALDLTRNVGEAPVSIKPFLETDGRQSEQVSLLRDGTFFGSASLMRFEEISVI